MSQSNRTLLANYLLGQQSGSAYGRNYVRNSMAVNNTENVSVTGTATVARNTTTPLTNIADFAITLPNNATDYVEFTLDALDLGLAGQNCQLLLDYKASSIGSNVQAQVVQGGVVAVTAQLAAISNAQQVSINTVCGTATTTVRISNATGNTGTSSINVANVTYGKATNVGTVSQAQLIGSAFFANGGNPTKSGGTLGPFSADPSFPGPTIITNPGPGVIQTTDTNLPQVTVNNLPAGIYLVTFTGGAGVNGTSDNSLAISDGTDIRGRQTTSIGGAHVFPFNIQATFEYSTAGNRTFELFGSSSASVLNLQNATQNAQTQFSIVRLPSSGEIAVSPNVQPVWGFAQMTSAVSVQNFTSASWITANNAGWTGYNFRGAATAPTTSGDLGTKIALRPGTYLVAASLSATASAASCSFGLWDGTNRRGISQLGISTATTQGGITMVGTFTYNTSTVADFRVQVVRNTGSGNCQIDTGGEGGLGDGPFEITVTPISQGITTPILVGSVTSQSTGAERIERAYIAGGGAACTSTPCTITRQSGSWLTSVSRSSTGSYSLNIASGIFTAAPTCTFATQSPGPVRVGTTPTTTLFDFTVVNAAGSAVDTSDMNIICMGPR